MSADPWNIKERKNSLSSKWSLYFYECTHIKNQFGEGKKRKESIARRGSLSN